MEKLAFILAVLTLAMLVNYVGVRVTWVLAANWAADQVRDGKSDPMFALLYVMVAPGFWPITLPYHAISRLLRRSP